MDTVKIKDDVYWVGVVDPELVVFDIVVPTEHGTTYNSYLVRGEKIAIVDTVKAQFVDLFLEKIRSLVKLEDISYIVINHTEPDHSGGLIRLMELAPQAIPVFSRGARTFVKNILHKEFEYQEVKDGDTIDLGNKTLQFISAPFLHWPDSMFTYLVEDKVLFPCDAFGSHYCSDVRFNDELEDKEEAFRAFEFYYNAILRPFKMYLASALNNIQDLEIDTIAPSHGPILRENLERYIDAYREWSGRGTHRNAKKKIAVVYVSSYGSTQKMAKRIAKGASLPETEVSLFNAAEIDLDTLMNEIEISDAMILGSPTLNAKAPKPIFDIISSLVMLNVRGKAAAVFGCYGWSGEAVQIIEDILKSLRFRIIEEGFKLRMIPSEEAMNGCEEFGRKCATALLKKDVSKSV
ncbi:MAG: FprA family A-type flavoprotein [Candidatus Scalindua sp. AMX11]|nr:MAG: FprA family A-type flavoprotein [Candidatus Scalindua sp.]NOG84571.1 FprA family A-type flavoprotein [Planctomycetota bacterium]RZV92346.1 MAG: FprA family A-type flavoprotein [Candidatus Scalindua sp. SCAELEC01]TDE66129.1 MAG: FprA family A-type flavoprotein [Candidatus Scalindua sp. AMX11]GJQ59103.1 MAG: FprA family A-type flavoprotein [Candidatus Scalindua sp.]